MRFSHFLRAGLLLTLCLTTACQRVVIPSAGQTPNAGNPNALVTSTPERRAVIKELEGLAEVRLDASGEWAPTSTGLNLEVGNQLRTGANSRAYVRLTEGSKIRLGPETAITFNLLSPFMDSLLTALALDHGAVWMLLTGTSALDVETPLGRASARGANMSVAYDPATQTLSISCLVGTCSLDQTFIPAGYKYHSNGAAPAVPEPMQSVDYGEWGLNVPEATELVAYATEAIAQGNATLPVVATDAATPPPPPTAAPTEAGPSSSPAAPPTTAPTRPPARVTPLPTLPAIGQHRVVAGETVFCLARVYGVLPEAIITANDLSAPFTVKADQVLRIPAAPWANPSSGPVCAPQFQSPYPGLPYSSSTPAASLTPLYTPTPAPRLEIREVAALCIGNCDNQEPTYRLLILVTAAGGAEPLTYTPGQKYALDFPRCTKSRGTVSVTSADGQTATGSWVYDDTACKGTPTVLP